jgi:hypothetical protein
MFTPFLALTGADFSFGVSNIAAKVESQNVTEIV